MLTIYKSSAGSGKTFTLVLEYLKIVIANPEVYRNVLAVTFTNKATEEMKNRIIDALSKLATSDQDQLNKDPFFIRLKEYFENSDSHRIPDFSIPHRARKVLTYILNDYSNFSVSTIESFFQRIVRAFARELNIPLGYDVEMKQDIVLDRIIDEMYADVGTDPRITRLFENFLLRNLEEEKSWNIDSEIKGLGSQIFKERFQKMIVEFPEEGDLIELTLELAAEISQIRKKFEQRMEGLARQAVEIMNRHGLTSSDFKWGRSGVPAYFNSILSKKKYEPGSRARSGCGDAGFWVKSGSPKEKIVLQSLDDGLMETLCQLLELFDQGFESYNTALQISRTIFSFGLLNDLQYKLIRYRRENNQLIISDTGLLLQKVISDQQDSPFIYEKTGNRYKHFLLDEFQDTSDMQWQNLLPLIQDALAQGEKSLLVGDVKQSIYRWRNGNMRLLLDKVEKQIEKQGQKPEVNQLKKNWRTASEIVNFNNQFFHTVAAVLNSESEEKGEQLFPLAYESVKQVPAKTSISGYVSIEFFPDRKRKDPPEVPGWQDLALQRTLELIWQLTGEEGFMGNEITLLVRKNSDGMKVASFLQQESTRQGNPVKVVSAESLLIASDLKVRLLQSLLQYLNHEYDAIIQSALVYYYQRVVLEENADHPLFAERKIELLSPEFHQRKESLRQLTVYECIEELIRIFPVLKDPNAYVQGFKDAVLSFASTENASISGFLEWWEEESEKRAIASAPEPDAVQITTIHKSKGLEFPIVIIPFADWELSPGIRDILWVKTSENPYSSVDFLPVRATGSLEQSYFKQDYEQEKLYSHIDNINLLYVAFTRPEYRLYVLTEDKDIKSPKTISQLINYLIFSDIFGGVNEVEERRFTVGEAISRKAIHQAEGKASQNDQSSIPLKSNNKALKNWNQAVRIKYSSNRFVKTDILTRTDKISTGELIHEALSYIKYRDDIDFAVNKLLGKGMITSKQIAQLKEQLITIVNNPKVENWFSKNWQIKTEAEVIAADGKVLRPDRVMIQHEEAIVIDYKTGQNNPAYHKQIHKYLEAMQKLGFERVKGYIYYLNLGITEEVVR